MTNQPPRGRETCGDDCCRHFVEWHEVSGLAAMREIERSVLGCDYGGTSWTTLQQAMEIVEPLGLRPGIRLLEVGSGAGWPGLFLAERSGCEVVLVDLPLNALHELRASLCALAAGLGESVELVESLGRDAVEQTIARRKEQIGAVDAALLVREIFLSRAVTL